MNKEDEDLVYEYIVNGKTQDRLSQMGYGSKNYIKSRIKELGFNKCKSVDNYGSDYNIACSLKVLGFNEDEIRSFISDYSDNYSNISIILDFRRYLSDLQFNSDILELGRLPKNTANIWRDKHPYGLDDNLDISKYICGYKENQIEDTNDYNLRSFKSSLDNSNIKSVKKPSLKICSRLSVEDSNNKRSLSSKDMVDIICFIIGIIIVLFIVHSLISGTSKIIKIICIIIGVPFSIGVIIGLISLLTDYID